jgi:hypothetical protein
MYIDLALIALYIHHAMEIEEVFCHFSSLLCDLRLVFHFDSCGSCLGRFKPVRNDVQVIRFMFLLRRVAVKPKVE